MKRSLGAGEWVRRGLGVAVLAAVVAIALGARYRLSDPHFAGEHGVARTKPGRPAAAVAPAAPSTTP